jgi:hypothetical protein
VARRERHDLLQREHSRRELVAPEAIDLGELGDWGYPSTYHHRFRNYVHSPLQHSPVKPDLVLIDGRFRVACFLHSLLTAEAGTPILFDDYTNRPYYHLVEEFCPIEQTEGRQALFRLPEELDRERIGPAPAPCGASRSWRGF